MLRLPQFNFSHKRIDIFSLLQTDVLGGAGLVNFAVPRNYFHKYLNMSKVIMAQPKLES